MKRNQNSINTKLPATLTNDANTLYFSSYEITGTPIKSNENKFSKADQKKVDAIFEILLTNPKQAIEKLLALKEIYPQAPVLYNYLSMAYSRVGNQKAMRKLITENYLINPGYLFAKINYAQLCLDKGEFEKIPEIFDHKFDLKLLYPHRNTFHVTEFAGFTGVMCAYYCSISKLDPAKISFDMLKKIAPESMMVNYAKHFLHPSMVTKFQRWVYKKRLGDLNELESKEQKEDHDYSLEA